MWIFMNDAMLSIVAHRTKPNHLLVRARKAGDIARVFPGTRETRTPGADYLYRAVVKREDVAGALFAEVLAIDYPNFKGSVQDRERHDAYMDVWRVMHRYQFDGERPPLVGDDAFGTIRSGVDDLGRGYTTYTPPKRRSRKAKKRRAPSDDSSHETMGRSLFGDVR